MKRPIADFISQCLCHQLMSEHFKPSGLRQRLPILEWKWDRITMDFMIGFHALLVVLISFWVIIKRLKKFFLFLPVHSSCSAKWSAKIYVSEVVRLHRAPVSIIFYRAFQFTYKFWRAFLEELGILVDLRITFHPKPKVSMSKLFRFFRTYSGHVLWTIEASGTSF